MIYALTAGLLRGALATWLLQRTEIKYLRDELRVAHAQIAHAVMSEGATIPARYEEPEPVEPLTKEFVRLMSHPSLLTPDPETRQICRDWDRFSTRLCQAYQEQALAEVGYEDSPPTFDEHLKDLSTV